LDAITIILLLLAAVMASSVIARASPISLPLPFVQIALGALIAQTVDFRVDLDPEIFLLLFIAPLLFLDGWRIPREGLLQDKWTIAALAFGLVVFTVVGGGFFIQWLIPPMPIAVAFALASVLSPTDAVAVSAIAKRVPIPKRLMHVLEGESLLNDASGLVCLRFAVAAALTGTFSIVEASTTFAWLVVGGIATGAIIALLATTAKDWISRRFGEEIGSQILISLLIPFGAYLVAEHQHASGILAAVAAGIVMNYEEQSARALAVTRLRRAAVWDAVQFAGNGVIFVLLGQQLPGIVAGAGQAIRETGRDSELWLLAYILAINCALVVLRSFWAWMTLHLLQLRLVGDGEKIRTPNWRLVGATSLAGVRGAVTLSGIMTLPLTLRDGSDFPTRDLAILLAAGVIVLSLIVANIGLPYVLKGVEMPPETARRRKEEQARLIAAEAAIDAVERDLRKTSEGRRDADLQMESAARIVAQYRRRIEALSRVGDNGDFVGRIDEIERSLNLVALRAERAEIYRIAHSGELTDESVRALVREIDLLEARFSRP
jgi:Na+/H+ antiporter